MVARGPVARRQASEDKEGWLAPAPKGADSTGIQALPRHPGSTPSKGHPLIRLDRGFRFHQVMATKARAGSGFTLTKQA